MKLLVKIFILLFFLVYSSNLFAEKIAITPAQGDVTGDLKDKVSADLRAAFEKRSDIVLSADDVNGIITTYNITTPWDESALRQMGILLNADWVVVPTIAPLIGQYRIELKLVNVNHIRSELLEGMITEGGDPVEQIFQLINSVLNPSNQSTSQQNQTTAQNNDQQSNQSQNQTNNQTAQNQQQQDTTQNTTENSSDEILTPPNPAKQSASNPPIYFGQDSRVGIGVNLGLGVSLSDPPNDQRLNGRFRIKGSYVLKPEWFGLEVGGDLLTFFGNGLGISFGPWAGVHYAPWNIPLFFGGELGIGFFKGLSAAERNSFLFRFGFNVDYIITENWQVNFSPLNFTFLFGDGDSISIYELNFGVSFRI